MSDESQDSAPQQRAAKPDFLTRIKFDDFNLPSVVLTALKESGFSHCTPIQARTLPVALTGRDVAGQAQTGTGKTAAFLITILTRLLENRQPLAAKPSALIVAPTRELSHQILEEAKTLGRFTDLSVMQAVGGVDYQKQIQELRAGVDIVVCTPGRIIDFYKQGIFNPQGIQILVIDEADRLFDLGFTKDMRFLLRKLPPYHKRQSMLFSATLSYRVLELTYEYMNLPEFISVTPETITVEGIEQRLLHVGSDRKLQLLLGLLKKEAWSRILIFVNTKIGVGWLTQKLKGNKWPAEGITGDLPQRKRFRLMERFKNAEIKILVATDVASRGIHVEDISHVINYDLPQDSENYIHRIGRTARAGKTGKAISLACEEYVYHLEPLEEMLGYKIPVTWPEDDLFVKDEAKSILPRRRGRIARSQQRRGRRNKPAGEPRPKKTEASKKRKVPGAFFGFASAPGKDGRTAPASSGEKPKKKKRRPQRRNKKQSSTEDRS